MQRLRAATVQARRDSEYRAAVRDLPWAIWLQVDAGVDAEIDAGMAVRVAAWDGQPANAGPDTCPDTRPDTRPDSGPCLIVRAPAPTWQRILAAQPPPGYQSFSAALRDADGFMVEGDALAVAQALHPLERLFEILRGQIDAPVRLRDRRAIRGHYAQLDLPGGAASLYIEESGVGAPLLMLHTAGADARQYHGLMVDPDLQARWRMIAFDLPGHGRSMPLSGSAWTAPDLRRDDYLAICQAVIRQWAGMPCVVLGCSMGAAMALYLAARSPDDVAGVVALEAPYRAGGRLSPMLRHPQVNQAAHNPAYVRGLMAPQSPLELRREAAWIYSQGGFGVYASDLYFYSEDFDASAHLSGLDGSRVGVSLLTGAYDYSARPEDSQRVAALIPGARYTTMPDLGHFPMMENPTRLLDYLRPELDWLASRLASQLPSQSL